jgi:putative ATP-dependent DNA ligase
MRPYENTSETRNYRKKNYEDLERDTLDSLPQIAHHLGTDFHKLEEHFHKKNIYLVTGFEMPFLRFRQDVSNIEKGTMVFLIMGKKGGHKRIEYLRGFPKIRRLMTLNTGLARSFKGPFYVEEKMNGYHVRTAVIDGKFVAATRGGLICPYTTCQIEDYLPNLKFFKDNPHLMLCGEAVGIQNPYQEKSYPEAKKFGYFVFDIRDRTTNKPFPLAEKYKLIKKYTLPAVRSFGKFTCKDYKKIQDIVRQLGTKGREGVVVKTPDMSKQAKYTANQSTNLDLDYAFKFMFDYGQAFMFRRLVREAFQTYELGLKGKQLEKEATELGKSILLPMVKTIQAVNEGKEVTEDFDITVPNEEFGMAFVHHLNHLGVRATIEKIEQTGKKSKQVTFKLKRHYPSTNDKIKAYLRGELCAE